MANAALTSSLSSCVRLGFLLVWIFGAEQCHGHFLAETAAMAADAVDDFPSPAPSVPSLHDPTTPRELVGLGVSVLTLLTPTCSQNLLGSNRDYSLSGCGNVGRRRRLEQQQQQPQRTQQTQQEYNTQHERALVSCADTPSEQFHWNCFQVNTTRRYCGCNFCHGQVCDPTKYVSPSVSSDPFFYLKQCCGEEIQPTDSITPGWTQDCVDRAYDYCTTLFPPVDPPCGVFYIGTEAGPAQFDSAFASANTECNDSGLTLAELTKFFNDITERTVQQSEVTTVFNDLDVDSDGFVDLDEFGALQGSVSGTFTANVLNTYTSDFPAPTVDSSGAACTLQTRSPTSLPPTKAPSLAPSKKPTTSSPTTSSPTQRPSIRPSLQPSELPSTPPSLQPTQDPSLQPSMMPSPEPSRAPSLRPSMSPTSVPSVTPSSVPSVLPSSRPTQLPTTDPKKTKSGKGGKGSSIYKSQIADLEEQLKEAQNQLSQLQSQLSNQQKENEQLQMEMSQCEQQSQTIFDDLHSPGKKGRAMRN